MITPSAGSETPANRTVPDVWGAQPAWFEASYAAASGVPSSLRRLRQPAQLLVLNAGSRDGTV